MSNQPPPPDDNDEYEEEEAQTESLDIKTETKEDDKQETKTKSGKINIDVKELEDFLADVTRLSTIIEKTSEKMNAIESSTSVVRKLKDIADLDMNGFKNKFRDMVHNLDLNEYAQKAVAEAITPLEKEYKDTNDLVKNLIFELEANNINKKPKKKYMSFIFGIFIILLSASSGFNSYVLFQNSEFSNKTNNSTSAVEITIRKGASVINLSNNGVITTKKEFNSKNAEIINGYYYFSHNNNKFKVSEMFVN